MNDQVSLHTLSGPHTGAFIVRGDGPSLIGRAVECAVCLLHEGVSRRHAALQRRDSKWYVVDQGGAIGTLLNGVRLAPQTPAQLTPGDLLRVGPFTFRVSIGAESAASTINDAGVGTQRVSTLDAAAGTLSARRLKTLTQCLVQLQAAAAEDHLARLAIGAALEGSSCSHGAVLRRIDETGMVSVVAASTLDGRDVPDFRFSGSLIRGASTGKTAVLSRLDQVAAGAHSIAELAIQSAICAPVSIADAVTGYLYLDSRERHVRLDGETAALVEAIASAYGLAASSLRRAELERRQREISKHLAAAREVQRDLLPETAGRIGPITYAAEIRPGMFVAGDLFDALDLGDGSVAVCIGDSSGHGIGSAMTMATTFSLLHGELRRTRDPAASVAAVNQFLGERSGGGRFVSLWAAVIDPTGLVRFVDAGHGHALLRTASASTPLDSVAGGPPVGIDPSYQYRAQTLRLSPADRLVLYSDGVTEQRSAASEQFGRSRLVESIDASASPADDVRLCFEALTRFAGRAALDDDATVASVAFAL